MQQTALLIQSVTLNHSWYAPVQSDVFVKRETFLVGSNNCALCVLLSFFLIWEKPVCSNDEE
jgi:hypothetical protein